MKLADCIISSLRTKRTYVHKVKLIFIGPFYEQGFIGSEPLLNHLKLLLTFGLFTRFNIKLLSNLYFKTRFIPQTVFLTQFRRLRKFFCYLWHVCWWRNFDSSSYTRSYSVRQHQAFVWDLINSTTYRNNNMIKSFSTLIAQLHQQFFWKGNFLDKTEISTIFFRPKIARPPCSKARIWVSVERNQVSQRLRWRKRKSQKELNLSFSQISWFSAALLFR